jgi:hypothetical protein
VDEERKGKWGEKEKMTEIRETFSYFRVRDGERKRWKKRRKKTRKIACLEEE